MTDGPPEAFGTHGPPEAIWTHGAPAAYGIPGLPDAVGPPLYPPEASWDPWSSRGFFFEALFGPVRSSVLAHFRSSVGPVRPVLSHPKPEFGSLEAGGSIEIV